MNSRELRNTLTEYFDEIDDIKTIADDAGIELGRINWTGNVDTAWREVLSEAEKQGITENLLSIVKSEYPAIDIPADNADKQKSKGDVGKEIASGNTDHKIYFSYAWGDKKEQGKSREKVVDELYVSLENDGFDVIRDKMDLGYGGLISQFMKDIGKGNLILVFISDKYLRSPYCMNELYEIYMNSRGNKAEFVKSILPINIEFINLSDPEILEKYFEHWASQTKKWELLIDKRKSQVNEGQTDEWQRIKKINQNFGDLTDYIRDINASSLDLLKENDFEILKDKIKERITI